MSLSDLPRGVLVHDWVEPIGGSENVLQELAALLPGSDLVCSWMNAPDRFPDRRIVETALSRPPWRGRKALALAASVAAWRQVPNRDYAWALVSSHAFAHHCRFVGQQPDFRKLVYVHSPARYVWDPQLDLRGSHPLTRLAAAPLRVLDRHRAGEPAAIAANSGYVADRVRRHWRREATVIHPPVDVTGIRAVADWAAELSEPEREVLDRIGDEFLLGASRLIPYKRLDRVVAVADRLGMPAVIVGDGPERTALAAAARTARVPVHLLGEVSTPLLRALYQRARCYLFPPVEDFGIMPIEAMAAGAPVVASAIGGTAESVVPGRSGALVSDWDDLDEVARAVEDAMALPRAGVVERSGEFSGERFAARVEEWVRDHVG